MSVAPDGSPVALYLASPGDVEARLTHAAIPEAAEILELGCGVGRVSRPLAELGHPVTGVDNSPEMLAAFPHHAGTRTILADIASLELERRFPVVVLARHLINGEDGAAFLRAAARHVTGEGVVLVQRFAPGWVDDAAPSTRVRDGVTFHLTEVSHPGPGVVAATVVFAFASATYRRPFVAFEVGDQRTADLAQPVGLSVIGYIGDDPSWVKLAPQGSPAAQSGRRA